MNDIPFTKRNNFCSDNESFRYLVALQDGIQFNDEEKHDYEMNWSISSNKSRRLIEYISKNLSACRLNDKWRSIKCAEVQITHRVRPMLEAMLNILRNNVLHKRNIKKNFTPIIPRAIHRSASIYLLCSPYPVQVGEF